MVIDWEEDRGEQDTEVREFGPFGDQADASMGLQSTLKEDSEELMIRATNLMKTVLDMYPGDRDLVRDVSNLFVAAHRAAALIEKGAVEMTTSVNMSLSSQG